MSRALAGYHSPQVEVDVRLNTNESPYPPPEGFLESMADEVRRIAWNRYPDRQAQLLREAVAGHYGADPANVFCANGSNEVIQCLLLALGGPERLAALFDPTYQLHTHISDITRTTVQVFRRTADFGLDPTEVDAALAARPDVLFLCSPNNPTGTVDDTAVQAALVERATGVVLIDEAYGEFAPSSMLATAAAHDRLAVCRTFSKVWSLAALRLGFLVGPAWLVTQMEEVALPYHLSAFTQAAGLCALNYPDEMNERVAALTAERERLFAELAPLVQVWPSGANFLLFRPHDGDGGRLWQRLLDRSVLVRDFSSRPGLEGCLRVSVGRRDEDDRFLEALRDSL